MTSQTKFKTPHFFPKIAVLRRPEVANLAETIKVTITLIKGPLSGPRQFPTNDI